MSDTFSIKITGTNQSHAAFQQLTKDAKDAGLAVEQVGEKSTRSFQQFNQRAAAFGAALGGATLLMGEFAKSAAEDEASQARLEQSITNTGDSLDDYSAKVELAIKQGQQKAFSDDESRDALVKLNLATNDTGKSIEELGLAMDLSRAKGISLGTAAEIIGKVMGGNIGILARYGIQLDKNATSEEALAAIQQRVAGQATAYAETSAGKLDIVKDKIDEMTEAWGAHAGAMQQVLLMLPGLQAGYVALAGVLGGVGGKGGLSALLKLGGPAALAVGAGALAYGYSQDTLGTTQTNQAANEFFMTASNVLNSLLPGNPYDTSKYTKQMATNANWDTINSILQAPGTSQDQTVQALAGLLGVKGYTDPNFYQGRPEGTDTSKYIPPTNEQILSAATAGAAAVGLPLAQFLQQLTQQAGWIVDPLSGSSMPVGQYSKYVQSRATSWSLSPGTSGLAGAVTAAPTTPWFPYREGANPQADYATGRLRPNADYYVPPGAAYGAPSGATFIGPWQGWGTPGPFTHRGSTRGATSGGMDTGAAPTDIGARFQTGTPFPAAAPSFFRDADLDIINAAKLEAALRDELGAYYHLADGINSAKEASSTFKGVQDSLIESEGVYGQQISEFGSQVSAVEAAHEVLNRRVAEGGKLTQEQQEFQDNYNKAIERGKGAIDDATVSQGLLGESYLLNMEKGDQINDIMKETADSTRDLVTVIEDLILSMEGIPPEVKTRIELERAQEAKDDLQSVIDKLNALDGRTATFYVEASGSGLGVSVGRPGGPGIQESLTGLHGGVVGYNNGGVVIRAGEAGPEHMSFANGGSAWAMTDSLYNVPRGTYVTPAPASRGRGGGNGLHFNGPVSITVVANDPRQMAAAINEWAMGSSRS